MLNNFFPDLGKVLFLERYWPRTPWWSSRTTLSDELLTRWAGDLTVENLLQNRLEPISVWSDRGSQMCVPSEARNLYESGCSLYIPKVEGRFSYLLEFIKELESDLGVPPGSGHCSVFASKAGAAIQPHCDHDFGFNVLISGQKRWSISNSQALMYPLSGHQLGRPPVQDVTYSTACSIPEAMPEPIRFCVEPGAVVFMPSGVWHSTQSLTNALSLDFAIDPPRRLQYIVRRIEERCGREVHLRAPIDSTFDSWLDRTGNPLIERFNSCFDGTQNDPQYLPLCDGSMILLPCVTSTAEDGITIFLYRGHERVAKFCLFQSLAERILNLATDPKNMLSIAEIISLVTSHR